MPAWLASLVVCLVVLCYVFLVVLCYVFLGGMRGTAWANAFQTAVFMLLGLVAFFTIAKGLGGADSLWASMQAASQAVDEDHLTRARVSKAVYFSFLLIPLSVAMFPHVFQHWLTARSASTFKLPIVVLARAFVVGIVAVTYLIALLPHRRVFDLSIWCFSGFVGLFPLVFAAIYWRRLTATGAMAGILATIVSWWGLFYRSGFGEDGRYAFPEPNFPAWILAVIPPLMPVVTIFVSSAVVMILVSLVTRPPSQETLNKFFDEPHEQLGKRSQKPKEKIRKTKTQIRNKHE